jgi:hypothetical protein
LFAVSQLMKSWLQYSWLLPHKLPLQIWQLSESNFDQSGTLPIVGFANLSNMAQALGDVRHFPTRTKSFL